MIPSHAAGKVLSLELIANIMSAVFANVLARITFLPRPTIKRLVP